MSELVTVSQGVPQTQDCGKGQGVNHYTEISYTLARNPIV